MLAGCVLVFLPAVGDFISAQLLGGPDTYMVGNLIQQQFLEAHNWPFGAALTIVLMAFLLICMLFYLRSARARPSVRGLRREAAARAARRRSTGRASCRGLRPWLFFLLWTFAPLAIVALFSFNSSHRCRTSRASASVVRRVLRRPSRCASRSSPASRSAS